MRRGAFFLGGVATGAGIGIDQRRCRLVGIDRRSLGSELVAGNQELGIDGEPVLVDRGFAGGIRALLVVPWKAARAGTATAVDNARAATATTARADRPSRGRRRGPGAGHVDVEGRRTPGWYRRHRLDSGHHRRLPRPEDPPPP